MTMRICILFLSCMAFAASTFAAAKPHVLLIMADDLGWKDLHCQGNDVLRTPYLDATVPPHDDGAPI